MIRVNINVLFPLLNINLRKSNKTCIYIYMRSRGINTLTIIKWIIQVYVC